MIKHFANTDSKLYRYAGNLMDLFTLNMIFLLTCLPIVTIGAANLALSRVTIKMAEGGGATPVRTYLKEFKAGFWRGAAIQAVLIASAAILFMAVKFLQLLPILSFVIVGIGILCAIVTLVVVSLLIFPYTARYENGFVKSFKVVWQVSALNLKESAVLVISFFGFLALASYDSFYLIFGGFFLFMIGFAAISLGTAKMVLHIFPKYE